MAFSLLVLATSVLAAENTPTSQGRPGIIRFFDKCFVITGHAYGDNRD
jgi:hypothetical protein